MVIDFFVGYSPERINPGDKQEQYLKSKITSGSSKISANFIDKFYNTFIKLALISRSIKIAEAAKVIENTQRI